MIGIYKNDFIDYLESTLDTKTKVTSKNIIIPCPWCEYQKKKDHYHMYISLEAPMFHCFHAGCEQKGSLKKLLKRIEGKDISTQYIDPNKLQEYKEKRKVFIDETVRSDIVVPELNSSQFPNKEMYHKKRLKFTTIPSTMIKGLIYDVYEFIKINNIHEDVALIKLKDYLHGNFIGFLTENNTTVIFRNVDDSHTMKFFKLKIRQSNFLDYYKLIGNNPHSNTIVLAEGIFDIFSEYLFDYLNLKDNVKLYASALSSKYSALIQSIVFDEMIFKPDVIILSDLGVPIEYYKKMKKYNRYIINTLKVYCNKSGKDFNTTPVTPVKIL